MPKSIFETCIPRDDILAGTISDQELAADLAKVVKGTASADYGDATQFFANTYPTIGLRNLLTSVCRRVSGVGGEAASIFRLDTSYGGGKTHGLIALVHAMRGRECKDLTHIKEFVDVDLLPMNDVRVAAFTGENADPANGRPMGSREDSIRAFTPWGEIAYELGGLAGYETVRESDLQRVAPGSETLQLLFNERAVLILLDELGVYLSKVSETRKGKEQLIPFLSSLIQAVENSPNSALVYTLAIDQKGTSGDAYSKENEFIGHEMAELISISGRKATLLNPTEINEYPHVLKRRFFTSIDLKVVDDVVLDYQQQWHKHREELESRKTISETVTRFQDCYPFHPDVLDTLTDKTFTINNFQRIRGMLRLLGRTITQLWKDRPKDAQAIHLHHIDLGLEEIKNEFIVRMELKEFVPAIAADISGPKKSPALAERIDKNTHQDMLPYATYVARTTFMHTVAFNETLKGLSPERLRFSILSSKADISFIESARKSFIEESAFLDDRPNSPMRFVTEPNLTRLIQIEEKSVNPSVVRDLLNDEIRSTFKGASFETVMFPGGPHDVSDDIGSDKPRLVILTFDAISIEDAVEKLPSKLKEIFEKRSSETQAPRKLRNHIVFLVAEKQSIDDMKQRARRRLALNQLKVPERIGTFAEHQQAKIHELESKSVCNLTIAIQTSYRHMFYPSSERLPKENLNVAHAVIEYAKSANAPGSGQKQIVRTLKEMKKLREPNDEPDHPRRTRDLTPLKQGVMTTLAFRNEFRENPTLPMLIGDSVFHKGIKLGIDQEIFVYRQGEFLYGPGDPPTTLEISATAEVMTKEYAVKNGIWPRSTDIDPERKDETNDEGESEDEVEDDSHKPVELIEEGLLGEVLVKIWEQADFKKVSTIHKLRIKVYESNELVFRLLSVIGTISDATKDIKLEANYSTENGGELLLEYQGPIDEFEFVREFLAPQMKSGNLSLIAETTIEFTPPVSVRGSKKQDLHTKLTQFQLGTVEVYLIAIGSIKSPTIVE